ncbi:MAG: hypothetical protein HQK51_19505 [Oligoflexia bacterium]|nr:hypothetical protein [Oligoflexia bacterium]
MNHDKYINSKNKSSLNKILSCFVIISIGMLMLLCSCKKDGVDQNEENLDKLTMARKLHNSGKIDEALAKYQEIFDENLSMLEAENSDVRLEYASVYADKAKINLYTFFPIIKMKIFNRPIVDWQSTDYSKNPLRKFITSGDTLGSNVATQNIILKLTDIIWTAYELTPYMASIPFIEPAKRVYIDKAIFILREGKNQNKEMGPYKSFLSAIQFINVLMDILIELKIDLPKNESDRLDMDYLMCNFDIQQYTTHLVSLLKYSYYFLEGIWGTKFDNGNLKRINLLLNGFFEIDQSNFDEIYNSGEQVNEVETNLNRNNPAEKQRPFEIYVGNGKLKLIRGFQNSYNKFRFYACNERKISIINLPSIFNVADPVSSD